jgi:K+-transporting ATPase ATPase A chain
MTVTGWAEIALVLAAIALLAVPLGNYIASVLAGERTFLSPVLRPVEGVFYGIAGVDPTRGMGWRSYAIALLMINALHFVLLYVMLRVQNYLPFNPQGMDAMAPTTAFNTAMSFVTNTNWQAYAGETTLSYGTQMWGLTVHNFLSAATGIAAAAAVARAFSRGGLKELGNFWADLTRITLYVLIPICLVLAIVYVILGIPMTLSAYVEAQTLDGAKQTIALGPVAFQEAIKELGTNGGGFFNVNSAHPFENPNIWSNIVETITIVLIPFALTITFGRIVGDPRQGRALFAVMAVMLIIGVGAVYWAEAGGNPLMTAVGVDPSQGNMEGKEVRFGLPMSALWVALTTGTSCGAVNTMHDSLTPLGGMVPLFLIQLGEILPGGVGSGLYGIIVYAILAMFVAGLMVGRTPEYLGKKLEAKEIKLAMLSVLVFTASILAGTGLSIVLPVATASLANAGPHGLSEMLYAWSSATGNNGSAFAGISADTPYLDLSLGIAMLIGRFAYMVPVLAIAGLLGAKVKLPESAGTFPTHGSLFVGLLIGVILIMGGLAYLPALSLGPIAEHFTMLAGKTF